MITIDEAIRTNTDIMNYHRDEFIKQELSALKLGIEALKRIQYARLHPFTETISKLPGETK